MSIILEREKDSMKFNLIRKKSKGSLSREETFKKRNKGK